MKKKNYRKRVTAGVIAAAMLAGSLVSLDVPQAYAAVSGGYGTVTELPGPATQAEGLSFPASVTLADANADARTSALYGYLKAVGESDYVLYGHQNDTHHKGGGSFEGSTSSDTKDLTGAISAIVGLDTLSLTGAELSIPDGDSDSVDEAVALSLEAASEGAILTLSAHMPNFAEVKERGTDAKGNYDYSGYSPNTTTGNVMEEILPGGELNEVYNGFLDIIARYAAGLQAQGVPVLFRPFHENNGSWFWWGAAYCDEEGYKNVFRYTVEYLRDVKGVHNFLYMYSPNGPFDGIEDYESRYPGDEYVDIVAFDMYHDNPQAGDSWMASFRDTVELVDAVAAKHGKVPAVAETGMRVSSSLGDGMNYGGIAPFGNRRPEWFSEVEEIVSASDMPYFMVWANFDADQNFFTPYKTDAVHGHEMSDAFIRFYNSGRSIFADGTNFYGEVEAPQVNRSGLAGYFLSPVSSGRVLTPSNVRASLTERAESVQIILSNEDHSVEFVLDAARGAYAKGSRYVYNAKVTREQLDALGQSIGTMELVADGRSLSTIKVLYNIEEIEMDPMAVDQFENYLGKTDLMLKEWSTNVGLGCSLSPALTGEYKSEGDNGLAFHYHITTAASGEGWAGMTKKLEADWSNADSLQLWIQPDGRGQKLVVQLTSGGEDFEAYLAGFAATTQGQYVTIPFAALTGKNGGVFDPSAISSFGIWCNTLGQTDVDSVMYFDDIHAVRSGAAAVAFGADRIDTAAQAEQAAGEAQAETSVESLDKSLIEKLMHLGPGYINEYKRMLQEAQLAAAASQENVIVTELFKEGSGVSYETTDTAWLMNSAPTDYVTFEYTCDDPTKAGWGIMGWGATVNGKWTEGPSYIATENPQTRVKGMLSIQALRRNFGIKAGSNVESISFNGWNGGRLISLTLVQGGMIPRNPVLLENGAADQSWQCLDIEYIRDLPADKILNLTIGCDVPGHSGWEIMSWGAQVNGQWVQGPKYNAGHAGQKSQISYTVGQFRQMMGMTENAKVGSLSLSVYNGGKIIRLAIDDAYKPSYSYRGGSSGGSSGSSGSGGGGEVTKPEYVSPNTSKFQRLINMAMNGGDPVTDITGLTGSISGWGQLDAESSAGAAMLKPGQYIVIRYSSSDGKTTPALWPKTADGVYRVIPAAYSNGSYAVFTYEDIAARMKDYLVPMSVTALSLAANGAGTLTVQSVAAVEDGDTGIVNEANRLTELWGQHELILTDYNSEYREGDTVTVSVALDKSVKGYIGANIGGSWNQGSELSGTTFTRTLTPDSDKVFISISDFGGASYVDIKNVKVDIAGKVNYNAAVEINAPQNLAVAGDDAKSMTEAAGMTVEDINAGTKLIVQIREEELTKEMLDTLENAPMEDGTEPLAAIDISLQLQNKDGSSDTLQTTDGKLRFVLAVPEGADTSKAFVVASICDGKVVWLEDLDDNPNTVTIETDRFSTHVISSVDVVTDAEIAEKAVLQTGNLSRLSRVMEKAENGGEITVAFLGGSITNGSVAEPQATSCYAYLTYEWWEKNFPNAKVHYVNAGIGATDSYLGVHRVAADVLAYDPDLVVVEYCVNDSRSHNQESYESLLRRILEYPTEPAVVGLFLTHYGDGSCPDYSAEHQVIAEHYDIPVVSYRNVVRDRLLDGSLAWTDLGPASDTTHPNNAGHKIISRCMAYFFDQVRGDTAKTYGDYSPYVMGTEAVTDSKYENGQILDHRSADGISLQCADAQKVTISEAQFPYGWQTKTGQEMNFTIADATNIGLIYYGGMSGDYGTFDVYVDGKYTRTINTNFYGSWGSHADYELILTSGAEGQHTVTIKKNADSTGDIFTILGFTVSNSEPGEQKDYVDIFTKAELDAAASQGYVNHSYKLSDYFTEPLVADGKTKVQITVTMDSDSSYSGAFGIGDANVEDESKWYSCGFSGESGEKTYKFTATPMYDNFILAMYTMSGEEVKIKTVEVSKYTAPEPADGVVASEENVKQLGRTYLMGDTLWASMSGSGIEFEYTGKKLELTIAGDQTTYNSGNETNYARIAIYVDDELTVDDRIDAKEKNYTVFESNSGESKTVVVRLVKLSEAACSSIGIRPIPLAEGESISPAQDRELKMEFIGDSITCGFGVDTSDVNKAFTTADEDVTKAYAYKTAQLLDADWSMVSRSGAGVLSGYTADGTIEDDQTIPPYYDTLGFSWYGFGDDTVTMPQDVGWEFDKFVPDAVVINLGTNDASYCKDDDKKEAFKQAYIDFLQQVREENDGAEIFCTLGIMGDELYPMIEAAVNEYCAETNDTQVHAFRFAGQNGSNGYGAGYHPSEASHEEAAEALAEEIRRVMNGEVEEPLHIFTNTWGAENDIYTVRLEEALEDYRAGQETAITVTLAQEATLKLCRNWGAEEGADYKIETGKTITWTFVPDENNAIYIQAGTLPASLMKVEVSQEKEAGLHTFSEAWTDTYTVDLGEAVDNYQTGLETTITVTMDREVQVKVARSWGTEEGTDYKIETGRTITWTFMPGENNVVYIQAGEVPAVLMEVEVSQAAAEDEPVLRVTKEEVEAETGKWWSQQLTFADSGYMENPEEFSAGDSKVRFEIVLTSDGSYYCGVGMNGRESLETENHWIQPVAQSFDEGTETKVFEVYPQYDNLTIGFGSLTGTYVQVDSITATVIEEDQGLMASVLEDLRDESEYVFTAEDEADEDGRLWKEFSLEEYGGSAEEGNEVTITISLEADGDYRGFVALETGGADSVEDWNDENLIEGTEGENEIEITFEPKGDGFAICMEELEGTYVSIQSISVEVEEKQTAEAANSISSPAAPSTETGAGEGESAGGTEEGGSGAGEGGDAGSAEEGGSGAGEGESAGSTEEGGSGADEGGDAGSAEEGGSGAGEGGDAGSTEEGGSGDAGGAEEGESGAGEGESAGSTEEGGSGAGEGEDAGSAEEGGNGAGEGEDAGSAEEGGSGAGTDAAA